MLLLVLRDLQFRRSRVALTISLMALVMTLLFLMSGLVEQFNSEPHLATDSAGGELNWVVSTGTGGPFTSPKPVDAGQFAYVAGEPILVAPSALGDTQVRLVARSYSFLDEPVLTQGRYPRGSGEVVTDETAGFTVGERTTLGGIDAVVVGLTRDTTVLAGVPLAFVTLEFGQQVAVGGQDFIIAKLTSRSPRVTEGLKVLSPQQIGGDALVPLDGAIASVSLIKALLWLIAAIIIAAIIYISALERARDFAVLKAVGGRTVDLGASLLIQSLIMALIAVLAAGLLQALIAPGFPLKVRVPSSSWITIAIGAAAASIVAATAGVLRVKSISPAEAFG